MSSNTNLYYSDSLYADQYGEQNYIINQAQQQVFRNPNIRHSGVGGLLSAAIPLLLLMIKLKNIQVQPDIAEIHRQAVQEIRSFDAGLRKMGYPPKVILAACYCLCTVFDEAVLGTVWGGRSAWVQQTLLSSVHQETFGGERFYIILNKMAEDPASNLDILELLYMLLSLGFEGQYFNENKSTRDEIRYTLFNLIRNYREAPKKNLSPSAVDERVAMYHAQKRIPLWHIGVVTIGILFVTMIGFNYKAYSQASPLLDSLKNIMQLNVSADASNGQGSQ